MLRIWKNELYDGFNCITSACPSNCCDEDWCISVDQKTYEALSELMGDINDKISSERPHTLIKKDHKCPFITDDGLCSIHADYGEEFLSNTCRSYPRFVSGYGDVYTMTIGLSCPEVARMIVSTDRIIRFTSEVLYESKNEKGKKLPKLESEVVMERTLSLFNKDRSALESFSCLGEEYIGFHDGIINSNIDEIMLKLRDIASEIGAVEQYDTLKLGNMHISMDDIKRVDVELKKHYPFLAQNICRCYLFERIMYNENVVNKDYADTFKKAEIYLLLFYCVLISNGIVAEFESDVVTDLLYRTMRLIDHNENIIELLSE
ncbi:flagellin lysine-N-methylase [Butyrivibrio sp. XPD2006]|uniref:flagellin lysine-N-methylase n=1 Tax=Butyrivibrio sp. XPD2006 TaxID=1280668 RepID=UPI0003B4F018|nr:flagellin lysine-N-methylase [Butyrivibrio sp. XPD2006]